MSSAAAVVATSGAAAGAAMAAIATDGRADGLPTVIPGSPCGSTDPEGFGSGRDLVPSVTDLPVPQFAGAVPLPVEEEELKSPSSGSSDEVSDDGGDDSGGASSSMSHSVLSTASAKTDRYGFVENSAHSESRTPAKSSKQQRANVRLENSRLQKWRTMLSEWDRYTQKKYETVKSRIRKGVPDALRAEVWPLLANSRILMEKNPDVYASLLDRPVAADEPTILRDLARTFPDHLLFSEKDGRGQVSLHNVLRSYARYDTSVGYCQGMGFIVAVLLSYMPEEESFWMFVSLMNTYGMSGVFRPGLPRFGLIVYQFEKLAQKLHPKLWKHMVDNDVHTHMFASQWFITLFSYNFPFQLTVRIWDIFLSEGWKIVFRVALAVLQIGKPRIMSSSFEGIMDILKAVPAEYDADHILSVALSVSITTNQISLLEAEYMASAAGQSMALRDPMPWRKRLPSVVAVSPK